jgi:ATP-binding cassette, subfamily B, bacterial IrtB/YbtQ
VLRSPALDRAIALLVAASAIQGSAFVVLLPILRQPAQAWPWVIGLACATVVYALLHYQGVKAARTAGYTLSGTLHDQLGDRVVALPLGWFSGERLGSFSRIVTRDVMNVMSVPAHLLEPLLKAVVAPAAALAVMFVVDWRLALAATATTPLIVLAYWWTRRLVRASDQEVHSAASEAAGRVVEFARDQVVLRAFGRGAHGLALLDDALLGVRDATRRLLRTTLPGMTGFVLAVQAAFTVVVVLAVTGRTDVPTVVVVLLLAIRFTEPVLAAAELGATLRMASGSLERVKQVLDEPVLPEPETSAPQGELSIEFDGVGFAPALLDVSCTVPARSMTAIVGPSGAGKTTLLRLAARFQDVQSGAVRVGGADVRDLRSTDLLAQICVVAQDVYLFEGSLIDNIRFGRPDASDADVRGAAARAGVDEIVARLPDGWDTQVGEGGARLSGGERQRVSIARALLKNAPILLLDEATSALDGEHAAEILRLLGQLRTEHTVLVVTHSLTVAREADQVVVIGDGRARTGRHHELMTQDQDYARFWRGDN